MVSGRLEDVRVMGLSKNEGLKAQSLNVHLFPQCLRLAKLSYVGPMRGPTVYQGRTRKVHAFVPRSKKG